LRFCMCCSSGGLNWQGSGSIGVNRRLRAQSCWNLQVPQRNCAPHTLPSRPATAGTSQASRCCNRSTGRINWIDCRVEPRSRTTGFEAWQRHLRGKRSAVAPYRRTDRLLPARKLEAASRATTLVGVNCSIISTALASEQGQAVQEGRCDATLEHRP